jgi:hypothetical protein
MAGILKNLNCHAIEIGGTEDHVHILLALSKKIQSFQKPCESVIAVERVKEWLDCQQVYEICSVIDRFIEALECQIEVFQSDRCQSFC